MTAPFRPEPRRRRFWEREDEEDTLGAARLPAVTVTAPRAPGTLPPVRVTAPPVPGSTAISRGLARAKADEMVGVTPDERREATKSFDHSPGPLETLLDIAAGNLVAPLSNRAAEMATDASLERFTKGGGDASEWAVPFGVAAAAGDVLGNVGASRAVTLPAAARTAKLGTRMAARAAAGAAENTIVGAAGIAAFGTEKDGGDDPMDILRQLAGNAAAGAAFGGVMEGVTGKLARVADDSPVMGGARTTGESTRGRMFAQAPDADPSIPAGVVRAFHGSPYKFDEFSPEKIGSGEGHQAYGHGLYFAESPGVAKSYQETLSQQKHGALPPDVLDVLEKNDYLGFDSPAQAAGSIASHRDWAQRWDVQDPADIASLNAWRDAYLKNKNGAFYTVDLDVEHAELLDWDTPVAQQGEAVRAALDKLRPGEAWDAMTGRDAYQRLARELGSPASASAALRDAGVPGVRYLDGVSRAKGDGSRNLVMFDPKKTKIVGRAGIIRLGRGPLPAGQEPRGTEYKAPIDDGKDPRLANLRKLNLAPEAEAKIRESYTRLDLSKRKVSWEETKAAADELGINPARLLNKEGRLRGDELLAVRDVISQNASRMVDLANEKTAATTDEARDAAQRAINALSDETDQYLKRYSTERTRAGRDLNALRIVARNTMDPAVWLAQAQRVKADLPLASQEAAEVSRLALANDRDGLIRYVSTLHRSSGTDKALAVWKAGLLTNPVTHLKNTVGNALMAGAETAKEVPAAAIDAVISAVRGTERTKAISARGLISEQLKGVSEGLRAARRTLQHGSDPDQLARWDFRRTNFGPTPAGRIAQAYTESVFNALGAQDALFKSVAMGRALEEYARLEARAMVKAGTAADFDAALASLRANFPPELMVKAIGDAEVATFQQENLAASAFRGMKAGLRKHGRLGEAAATTMDVIVPFVKTPTNVAGTLVQYSPLGLVSALVKQIGAPSQKRLAEDLGRTLTGSTLVALGFMLAREGKATGAAPSDRAERAQWDLENKSANSVRIGKKWVNVSTLSPVGSLVAVGAQMFRATQESDSPSGQAMAAALTPGRVALDQSFLKGVSGALNAVNDPARYGESFAENTAGSVVPAAVAAVARGTDPFQRDPAGPWERIVSRVPGASRSVPPRLNAFGQPMKSNGGVVAQAFDITQAREANETPLLAEMRRLGVTVGFPGRNRTINGVTERRTEDDYRALLERVGPETERRLAEKVRGPAWKLLDDETRKERLEEIVTKVRGSEYKKERLAIKRGARRVP